MKRGLGIIVCLSLILVLSFSLASAGWFGDLFGKKKVTGEITTDIDSVPPTYYQFSTNNTITKQLTKFAIKVNDDLALYSHGQYIFSTNNTGVWFNDTAVYFTTTPSWANVTKILNYSIYNSSVGKKVGYRWYLTDNAGNKIATPIYFLTVATDCIDSDGGDIYGNATYISGTARVISANCVPDAADILGYCMTDHCVQTQQGNSIPVSSCTGGNCFVSETICIRDYGADAPVYPCSHGCTNGACIPATPAVPLNQETRARAESVAPEDTTPNCTDSDGGKDYYVKGTTYLGNTPNVDVCSNSSVLWEYSCDDANTFRSESYSCPNGCDDGACKPICGNNRIESTEVCDGTDLSGQTCASVLIPIYSGVLGCNQDCAGFDTSECSKGKSSFGNPVSSCRGNGECTVYDGSPLTKDEIIFSINSLSLNGIKLNGVKLNVNGKITNLLARGSVYKVDDGTYIVIKSISYNARGDKNLNRVKFLFTPSCKNKCYLDGKCYAVGQRKGVKYCADSSFVFKGQLKEGSACGGDNYKCISNVCTGTTKKCTNSGFFKRVISSFLVKN